MDESGSSRGKESTGDIYDITERETKRERFISRNWNTVLGVGKSEIHRAGQQAGHSVRTDVAVLSPKSAR